MDIGNGKDSITTIWAQAINYAECVLNAARTVLKYSMTASTAGVNPDSVPNSDSSMRRRSSWSPVNNQVSKFTVKSEIKFVLYIYTAFVERTY